MARTRRTSDNQANLIETLKTGMYPSEDESGNPLEPPSEESLKAAWAEHGDALVDEFIRDGRGCRPWGFWVYGKGAVILKQAGRSWPLTVIGRRGGCRIRNRNALSAFEQERLLSGGDLPRVGPTNPTRNITM